MDTIGTHPYRLSFVERLSSFGGYFVQSVYTRAHLVCPLLGGLSSFGVSFIGGFTVLLYLTKVPRRIFVMAFVIIHTVCSGAPNCTAINREACSMIPNTCGPCLQRHLTTPGQEGFSNELCFGTLECMRNHVAIGPSWVWD